MSNLRTWIWTGSGTIFAGCLGLACFQMTHNTPSRPSAPAVAEETPEVYRPIPCPVLPPDEPIAVHAEPLSEPLPGPTEEPSEPPEQDTALLPLAGPAPRPELTSARMPYADETESEFAVLLRRVAEWRAELPARAVHEPAADAIPSTGPVAEESEEPPLFDNVPAAPVHCPYLSRCPWPRR